MKRLRLLFSLLCVCVFSLGLFSSVANAEVVLSDFMGQVSYSVGNNSSTGGWYNLFLGNNTRLIGTENLSTFTELSTNILFKRQDGKPIAESGEYLDVYIDNIVPVLELGSEYFLANKTPSYYCLFLHTSSGVATVDSNTGLKLGHSSDLALNFYAEDLQINEDVVYVELYFRYEVGQFFNYDLGNRDFKFGCDFPTETFKVTFDTEEAGLLKNIMHFLREAFNNVGNWFKELATNIINGLKTLFVPTTQDLVEYRDKWDTLASNRFGAIYECFDMIVNMWEEVEVNDVKNTIDLPRVTIPVSDGQTFSFGGYEVKVIPSGFESIVEILKTIISILCTFAFINGCRKRYDDVFGGGSQ